MTNPSVDVFAKDFFTIFREHRLTRTSATDIRDLSLDEAYTVQEAYLAMRIAEGERVVGYKVGCTSSAIRGRLGLSESIFGQLLTPHLHRHEDSLYIEDYVDCALEAELVFHIGIDLDGTNLETSHLRGAISAVSPGIEIHNSRFWYGAPSSQELIASNGIHAGLVIGTPQHLPPEVDLDGERSSLAVNGVEMTSGFGAELMEGRGPIDSLRWLLTQLRRRKMGLRPGQLVIPGSAAKLILVKPGDCVEARFTHFGLCRAVFLQSRFRNQL